MLAHLRRTQPWTLHPTGGTMSSGQQPPRRVTNVGSLLLTPQENESLFSFLGKKCVVSGRDPVATPHVPWRVRAAGTGEEEGEKRGGRGEAGGPAAGQASSLPGPWCCPRPAPRVQAGPARSRLPELLENKGVSPLQAGPEVQVGVRALAAGSNFTLDHTGIFFVHQQLKSQHRTPALALALLPTSGSGLSSLTMLRGLRSE